MGKKNFFKFPSKKTMEHILIGILFVAVFSCTMKMIKNIEGFNSCSSNLEQPLGGTCTNLSSGAPSLPLSRYSITLSELDEGSAIIFSTTNSYRRIDIGRDRSESVIQGLFAPANTTVFTSVGNGVIQITPITTGASNSVTDVHAATSTNVSAAESAVGVDAGAVNTQDLMVAIITAATAAATISVTSGTIDTCAETKTALQIPGGDTRTVTDTTECIDGCETYQEDATNCNLGETTGCSLNAEGGTPSCECTTAITIDADSWYKLDNSAFDVNSCLQKSIQNVFGNDGETLGANQAASGWTNEQGDVCSPRWPCIDSQSDYISIIEKSIGSCNQDNDNDQDNEMKLSFCQPYGENASFEDCNGHKNKNDCEGHSDVDGDKCAWNPYCLQNSGTRSGINGIEGGAPSDPSNDPRPCKAHLDHQNCMNDNDCFWNWGLAEELNGFRNSDNEIVSTNVKISDIKSRFSSTSQDVCRDDSGSTVDNIHCSVLSGLNTITSDRDLGFCPGESCSATDSTHAYCQYCSSFALDDNTVGFIPSGLTGLIEDARVYTGTYSGNPDINIENNRCHKLFRN